MTKAAAWRRLLQEKRALMPDGTMNLPDNLWFECRGLGLEENNTAGIVRVAAKAAVELTDDYLVYRCDYPIADAAWGPTDVFVYVLWEDVLSVSLRLPKGQNTQPSETSVP